MILLHHPEAALSRALLNTRPHADGCAAGTGSDPGPCSCALVQVVDWSDELARASYAGPAPSALPSVVVAVPAYAEDGPLYGPEGEFLGIGPRSHPSRQEALRLPASWEAVAAYAAFVQARAGASAGG